MANGKYAGGDGSKDNPYLIEDAFDLNAVRNGLDKCYKLINDIDLNVTPFNEGEGWLPIGEYDDVKNKKIYFDGNNYTIYNLYINNKEKSNLGLFKYLNGEVHNLNFNNANCIGRIFVGILCSTMMEESLVSHCSIKNSTLKTFCFESGILAYKNEGKIEYCGINNCKIDMETKYDGNDIGNNCGLLVGWSLGNKKSIDKTLIKECCIHDCSINLPQINKRPIAESCNIVIGNMMYPQTISNIVVYNMNINKPNKISIMMYNRSESSKINNIFIDKNTTPVKLDDNNILHKTTQELKTPSTFVGWEDEKLEDGTPIWILKEGKYPKLWFEKDEKFLLKQGNKYYKINGNKEIIETDNNIKDNGFTNESLINKDILNTKFDDLNEVEILYWIDDEDKQESVLTYDITPFKPIDKLKQINNGKFDVIMKKIV